MDAERRGPELPNGIVDRSGCASSALARAALMALLRRPTVSAPGLRCPALPGGPGSCRRGPGRARAVQRSVLGLTCHRSGLCCTGNEDREESRSRPVPFLCFSSCFSLLRVSFPFASPYLPSWPSSLKCGFVLLKNKTEITK